MSEIPSGEYELKLGATFSNNRNVEKPAYHTLRYDFKPQSAANDTDSFIAVGSNGDVQVVMPTSSDDLNVFKGSQKPVKAEKECLLFFDPSTGTIRLEKLNSNIAVKKTRDLESTENLRAEVERLRAQKKIEAPATAPVASIPIQSTKQETESSDSSSDDDSSSSSSSSSASEKDRKERKSSSSSSSDSDSTAPAQHNGDSESDDELSRVLEEKMLDKDEPEIKSSSNPFDELDHPAQPLFKPGPVHKTKTKDLMNDLQLSESSDED